MEKFAIVPAEKFEQLLSDVQNIKENLIGHGSALNDYVTEQDLCKKLGRSSTTLWRWEKEGRVKSKVIGNKRLYKLSEIIFNGKR